MGFNMLRPKSRYSIIALKDKRLLANSIQNVEIDIHLIYNPISFFLSFELVHAISDGLEEIK